MHSLADDSARVLQHKRQAGEHSGIDLAIHTITRVGNDPIRVRQASGFHWVSRSEHAAHHAAHLCSDPVAIRVEEGSGFWRVDAHVQVAQGNALSGDPVGQFLYPFICQRCRGYGLAHAVVHIQ